MLINRLKSAITSLSKQDGSNYKFLNCSTRTEQQTVKIFYNTNITSYLNCYKIFKDGVKGTVIKLPDNCGLGTYAITYFLTVSEQQVRILNLFKADIHPLLWFIDDRVLTRY